MAKDIFGDDYFERHRDSSSWRSLGKKKLHEALNIKHKPKPKLDDIMHTKEDFSKDSKKDIQKPQEKIVDEDYKKYTSKKDWKTSYFKLVLAGLVGGFLVILIQQINLFAYDLLSAEFWINAGIAVLIGLTFILLFGILYKHAE